MSTFGTGSTTTAGASITLRAFSGTDGQTAGTDGLVPGPSIAQQGYVLGAGGDWALTVKQVNDENGQIDINESSDRIATTKFVSTLIGNAQLGGGNANLSALGDVSFANLATGQFLQYNTNGNNNWSNITLTLATISDVDLAGLQDGNALVYDAGANNGAGGWVPGEGGGGGAATLNGLGDVTINGGANKHFLVRNGDGQYVNRLISSADLSNTADIILRDGTVAFTGNVSLGDFNLTNVGDLALDTISSDGTTISVSMTDDTASAFSIKEGNNSYLTFNTTDDSEKIVFHKPSAFGFKVEFHNDVIINESGNGVDFRVDTGTKTHALFTDGGTDRVGIFQNAPTVPLDVVGDTKITGDLELTGNVTALNLGTASANATGDFLASNSSIDDLNDVSLGGALVNGKILKVVAGEITQADETDTNTQLSTEQVQDIVGDMVDGGTETDITVAYDDVGGKLNFVVDNTIARLDDPDFTGTPTAPTALIAIDNTQIATTAFVHDLVDADINALGLGTASTEDVGAFLASDADINDLGGISTAGKAEGKILKFNAQDNLVVADDEGKTQEEIEDIVGGMVDGNTETGITVTYQGADNTLDFEVDNTIARVASPTFTGVPSADTAAHDTNTTQIATTEFVLSQISGTDINILEGVSTANKAEGKILKFNAQGNLEVADETGKTQEEIEDIVGGMVVGNTETGITVTYQGADNTLDFEVDNTSVGFLGGVQTFTGNKTFTGEVNLTGATATGATQNASDNSLSLATTAYVDAQIDTDITALDLANNYQALNTNLTSMSGLNIVDGSMMIGNNANSFEILTIQLGVENFLKSTGRIASLSDITFDNDELTNANHFIVSTGNGGFENKTISTANLSNSGDIVLETADATFGANTYNFTGATAITVPAPNNGSDATTKTYVDTKQPLDATLTELAGLATGAKKLIYSNTGNDDLEMTDLSDKAKTFIASDAGVGDLDGVTFDAQNNALGDGQTLRYDGANTVWKNSKLAFGDLSDVASTQNVVLLNNDQTITGDKTFTGAVDLTGATTTAETVANNNAEGNSTRVATTAFVKTVLAQVGGVSDLDDLTDVNLGVKVVEVDGQNVNDGVALADAHILIYDADGGNNDTTFKNVSISGDITITNAGVVELADDSVTSTKIENSSVANAKLQTPYLDLTVGGNTDRLNLGETFTIAGTASEIEVSGLADAQGANAGATLTIGLPDDVTIGQDLTVTRNLIVNGTTTTLNTATLDVEDTIIRLNKGVMDLNDGAGGANPNDIGLFFERGTTGDDAIFYWDEGDDFFKLGLTTNDDHEATDFGATTTPGGLQIGSLELRDNLATSLVVKEGANAYLTFDTSDGTEKVVFGKVFEAVSASKIGDVEISNGQIQTTAVNNNLSFNDNNLTTTGTANFGGTTVDSLDASSGGITLAGAISGITSLAGSDLDLNLTNNEATAFEVKGDVKAVGNNSYLTFVTTNNSEEVVFNQGGVDIDFRVEGEAQTHLLYADATNDRIGINTDTPLAQVHVVGSTVLVGGLTQSGASATFNNGEGDFDFRVAGDNQSNLFFVDASTDRVGVRTNTPAKILDVVGDVGISTTLDVTGKTTLAGSLDLTTGSTDGITFRSEIAANGADAGDNVNLLRVNIGANGGVAGNDPLYRSVLWNPDMDRFEVESGLKSTGNFTVGGDLATINATTGVTSIKGATTINNSGGTADLIVQNNGADVLNVDVSAGLTAITGIATVSSQLKTDDLRGLTAGTGNFHIRLEDNIANALEILDATNSLSFMTFTTTDDSESITLAQDAIFKKAISIEHTNTNGLFFNSNRSGEVSEDATLITIEGGSNKNDVVLAWDTSDNAINLNPMAQMHLQGRAGDNALTIGGALVANATIVMTTAGAITLDGTLDSPTINTDKITNKNATSLEIELADNQASALFIQQGGGSGNGGEDYLTLSSANGVERITLHQNTTIASQLQVNASTTLGGVLNLKSDNVQPLIKANSDLTAENAETDATLIEVERGTLTNAKFKWDETSNSFEFDAILSAEGNFQVGIDAQNPKATINSTTGNLSTDGTISATSSITTDSVVNFTTASQGAIVFNSDLGNGVAPANTDDFGLTVNRGTATDAKLYWDEGDTSWKLETGDVHTQNKLVIDSAEVNKIEIEAGSITTANDTGINFGSDNLTTLGSITSATPALGTNSTVVATTAFVKGQKLGDLDQVDTSGFDTTGQVLTWDQENSTFEVGSSIYNAESARDDVGAALNGGTHTGATTITFTNDDANNVINLALGITTEDLTDVSADQATNNQVLRFTTAEGANQNKYVPTTLGTASDVDTGLSNGNVPTLSTHFHSTKTNEVADLVITGRIIESIDYGQVSEAFDENTDFKFDCGFVTDTGISSWEDYGQLVV